MAYSKLDWDEAKNLSNQRKHGVSFDEASALFRSENYLEVFDAAHSFVEMRFLAIGPIARGIVIVAWTERPRGTIRIISARWATKNERSKLIRHLERQR